MEDILGTGRPISPYSALQANGYGAGRRQVLEQDEGEDFVPNAEEDDEAFIKNVEDAAEDPETMGPIRRIRKQIKEEGPWRYFVGLIRDHPWIFAAIALIIVLLLYVIYLQSQSNQPLSEILAEKGLWFSPVIKRPSHGKKEKKRRRKREVELPEISLEEMMMDQGKEEVEAPSMSLEELF